MKHAAFSTVFSFVTIVGAAGTIPAPCSVPSDRATIQAALNDPTCDPVNIPAGTFKGNFTVGRGVIVNGAGPGMTILDGQNSGHVIAITSDQLVQLTGLTIQHGNAKGPNFADLVGGGIAELSGPLVLFNCVVTENITSVADNRSGGGGIYSSGGDLSVIDTEVSENTAGGSGGGVESDDGNMVVIGSTVSENSSRVGGGGIEFAGLHLTISQTEVSENTAEQESGGGIDNDGGPLDIDHSLIAENTVGDLGGGIASVAGDLHMTDSTVEENTASGRGGGILQEGSGLSIERSTISENTVDSGDGGGISAQVDAGSVFSLVNTTVTENSAFHGNGGGIYVGFEAGTTPSILNCTIFENTASTGGGIFAEHLVASTTKADLANTIVVFNSPADCAGGLIQSLGHNLAGDSSCPFTAAGDLHSTNPLLGGLAVSFPGDTATNPLLPGSPAINAGDDSLCPALDQRGIPRPQGKHCDIGSFEVTGTGRIIIPGEGPPLAVVGGR